MGRREELLVPHAGKERNQQIVKPKRVEDPDRFEVQAKLKPGERLGNLLQRADPPGQSGKRPRHLRHALLALVHGADGDEFGEVIVRAALGDHHARNDPNNAPARRQRRVRQRAHQPRTAPAVDNLQPPRGAGRAKRRRHRRVLGRRAKARPRIDTNPRRSLRGRRRARSTGRRAFKSGLAMRIHNHAATVESARHARKLDWPRGAAPSEPSFVNDLIQMPDRGPGLLRELCLISS